MSKLTTEPVIDTCETCQNWGANQSKKHDDKSHPVVVIDENKEPSDEQVVPVYIEKASV